MNANELADDLEELTKGEYGNVDKGLLLAATMLRQQQSEIESMKNPIMQAISQAFEPAKTLTDEEIDEIALSIAHSQKSHIDFARAILKKAQEK